VLHDRTLDRTTGGHGLAADFALEQIRSLDARARFNLRFAGTRVPTSRRVVDWTAAEEMGIFLEIKEAARPDLAVDRAGMIEAKYTADRTILIGFDHVVLNRAAERHPRIGTQAITHARHADILGVLNACAAISVSIELDMFHPDDAKALHDARFSVQISVLGPRCWAAYRHGARDAVPFVARLVESSGAEGSR
jgi:glycerophosphoryl diester phosphodiesterase